ncbi:IS66 family transposase [Endozoicomonas lisbonensis]|uniref:Transposase n=1 Tax=Endozoicomonas lisbonensis TaxID=3120522 RepID=A0ABV2SP61_9GAMM
MEACPVPLPDNNPELIAWVQSILAKNALLEERLRLLLHKQFGASSEKTSPDQQELFNEAEQDQPEQPEPDPEESVTVAEHTRQKKGRKPLPKDLPRVREEHDIRDDEKNCSGCGNQLHRIGEEVTEQLDIIPAKIRVIQNVRFKYGCRCCEEGIKTAKLPAQPIPGSIATPGLLAFIATSKYVDGLPLYRQEKFILARLGVDIARATTSLWMVRCGDLVQPLINLMRDKLLEAPLIHCDETVTQVLNEEGKAARSHSYMWVQVAEPVKNQKIILFDYAPSRSGSVPMKLLDGFRGYLQTDGYEGYAAIGRKSGVISQGCWAHARRKFDEAIKGQKDKNKTGKSHMGLSYIRKLYQIEHGIKESPPDERKRVRQEQSLPVLQKLRQWLDKSLPQVPPKTLLGKALYYLNNQWEKLIRYCDEGYLRMDNNLAENAIRPFVVGRKAWLFSNSTDGAKASANLYSLVETAKACGLEPCHYLKTVFNDLPRAESIADIEQLLPWNQKPV